MKLKLARGTYRVIRADGSEAVIRQTPTMSVVASTLRCGATDALILEKDGHGTPTLLMIVDDLFIPKGLPVNEKATAICREYYGSMYRSLICGDVVIADDRDFG